MQGSDEKTLKELVMTKKDNKDFKISTKSWTCYNTYFDDYVKETDHCHINQKYRGSVRRDWNTDVNSNKTQFSDNSFFWVGVNLTPSSNFRKN